MPIKDHVTNFCRTCGELACRCGAFMRRSSGVIIMSAMLSNVALAPAFHALEPTPGVVIVHREHQPHTEQQMDTRPIHESLKISAATVGPAGSFYRIYGPDGDMPRRFSGYQPKM